MRFVSWFSVADSTFLSWFSVADSTFLSWSSVADSTFLPWSSVADSTFLSWSSVADSMFSPDPQTITNQIHQSLLHSLLEQHKDISGRVLS